MSKLYFTEQGRVISTLCEEITCFRRVRKVLKLPSTYKPGWLYFLAYAYPGSSRPLFISVNGNLTQSVAPRSGRVYTWYTVYLKPEWLKAGENVFEFWNDSSAMDAWSLAIESGHAQPGSYLSDDGGQTWRNEKLGYLNVLLGEYVVRVRLEEGQDPPPPAITWEVHNSPRLESLRKILPPAALEQCKPLAQVRTLTTWLSTSWAHESTASLYAPWDPETILRWGSVRKGQDGRLPVTMCVHYAVALVSACMALHIPARCLVGTDELNSAGGHFVTEVWFSEFEKWGVVDPNTDTIFLKNNIPISVSELRQAGGDAGKLAVFGPGVEFQSRFPHMNDFIKAPIFQDATWADHRCLWPRTDFLTHPEFTPPGHGVTAYCETDLVWEMKDRDAGFGMFPYFGDEAYFTSPPSGWEKAG